MMRGETKYYDTLGVSPDATDSEIKKVLFSSRNDSGPNYYASAFLLPP